MLAEERLSAAFKKWDQNRTLLHGKRRELGVALAAFRRGDAPEPALLATEVACLDEICTLLFGQLLAVAEELDAARGPSLGWPRQHLPPSGHDRDSQ